MHAKYLAKKSWHTGTIKNQEKVWLREQERKAEDKKLEELQKQLAEERQMEELRAAQKASGLKSVGGTSKKMDWMYQGPMHLSKGFNDALGSEESVPEFKKEVKEEEDLQAKLLEEEKKEEFLLGKEVKVQPDKDAFEAVKESSGALLAGVNATSAANEQWLRVHSDPMLEIKRREQEALRAVLNNPMKMMQIKAAVEAKTGKKSKKRDKKDKKHRKKDKKERKEKKKRKKDKRRSRSRSRSGSRERGGERERERGEKRARSRSRSHSPDLKRGDDEREERNKMRRIEEQQQEDELERQRKEAERKAGYGLVMTSTAKRMHEVRKNQPEKEYVPRSYKPPSERDRDRKSRDRDRDRRSSRDHRDSRDRDRDRDRRRDRTRESRTSSSRSSRSHHHRSSREMTEEERQRKVEEMQKAAQEIQTKRKKTNEEIAREEAMESKELQNRNLDLETQKPEFLASMQKAVYNTDEISLEERIGRNRHSRQDRVSANSSFL
eukprot:TRINITY_DN2075_c0_g1_i4.p1 TRINITY_DN2075_c0_g1~~TRINITY_DN2075_c0_g1_i4.p1  ORF type:complete len:494 (+),score=165.35 TRINITY_DN2075_c0_g1_i4:240-1721(+)